MKKLMLIIALTAAMKVCAVEDGMGSVADKLSKVS